MPITIKSSREIELMTEAGHILEKVLDALGEKLAPGMTTKEIDIIGEELIRSYDCIPSFLNYNGYPASICVSVNEEVVHGIPNNHHRIKEGDIVSLDAGVIHKGYHSDAARTYPIGKITQEAEDLIRVTRESFFCGIEKARAGNYLGDISAAIDQHACKHGYGVVRDLCGHGIGTRLHEPPEIPNYTISRRGVKLKAGMTLAIEPMINMGTWEVEWLSDDWTVVTKDGSLSAHYENTVLITEDDPILLTYAEYSKKQHAGK